MVTSLFPRRTPTFHLRDLRGLVIRMDFGPAFKSSRGRYKTATAVHAAAFVARAICVWVAPPPSGDAYPPPLEARRTYTALSVHPLLSDRHRPHFSWLTGPDGYCGIYTLLCSSRTRFDGSAWLDGRPACRGALVTQGSPALRKTCHHC